MTRDFLTANGSSAAQLSITVSPTVDLASASAVANTATSTPLLLQRGESTYSETSVKPAIHMTPLQGKWADESPSWETAVCSPIPQVTIKRDSSGASFESAFDDEDEEVDVTLSPMCSVEEVAADEPTVVETAAAEQPAHVLFAFRFNPYSMKYATTELPHCDCLDCAAAMCRQQQPAAAAAPAPAPQMINPYATTVEEEVLEAEPPQPVQPVMANNMPYTQESQYGAEQYAEPEPTPVVIPMRFVVPPPPPRIVRRVMSESVDGSMEGAQDAVNTMYYNALMRWYNKVAEQQVLYFENPSDYCPSPDSDVYGFDDWAAAAGQWWLRYFEHAQKKTHGTVMPAPAAPSQSATAFQSRRHVNARSGVSAAARAPAFSGHRGTGGFACHSMPVPNSWRQKQEQAATPAAW